MLRIMDSRVLCSRWRAVAGNICVPLQGCGMGLDETQASRDLLVDFFLAVSARCGVQTYRQVWLPRIHLKMRIAQIGNYEYRDVVKLKYAASMHS